MNDREKESITSESSSSVFKFGDGKLWSYTKCVTLPCELAEKRVRIKTDVVEPNIPMLPSRSSMKKASMVLDFVDDAAVIFGNKINLNITVSGHYTISIYRAPTDRIVCATLFSARLV